MNSVTSMDREYNFSSQQKPLSFIKIILWTVALLFLAQIVLGFLVGLIYGIVNAKDYSEQSFEQFISYTPYMLIFSMASSLLTIPLLKRATYKSTWKECFEFWAIKPIVKKELMQWLVISLSLWIIITVLARLIEFPIEQFMLDIKDSTQGSWAVLIVFLVICIVAPIIEELIFRGWLFGQLELTRLGNIGAITVSTFVFTVIHYQYEQLATFFFVFVVGLFLAIIRSKTKNLGYCIFAHMFFNTLAMIELYLFV